MIIQGTVISTGRNTAHRREGALAKAERRKDALAIDAARQEWFRLGQLTNKVTVAENDLRRVQGEAARLEADIAEMRHRAAETGRPNPAIATMLVQLAELPAMVLAAEDRLDAARAALKSEQDRQDANARADAAAAAVEAEMRAAAIERAEKIEAARASALAGPVDADTGDAGPVIEPARGRGRPPKGAQ